MANLPSNSLKQEEIVGNFQIDDSSNDSFKLNQGIEYPGDLSEFYSPPKEKAQVEDEVQDEAPSSIEQESQEAASQPEESQQSIWNAFQENFGEELDGRIDPFGEDENQEELVGKIDPFGEDENQEELVGKIDPFGEDENEEIATETAAKQSLMEDDAIEELGIDKAFQGMQTEEKEDAETEPIGENAIDLLGDDLRKIIENDIKRAKKKKPKKKEPAAAKELTDEEIKEKIESFKPVDNLAKSQVFNFEDIEAEHPSKIGQKPIPDDLEFIEYDKKEKIKAKPEKKEKTKRAIPFLLTLNKIRWAVPIAALIAGVVLLIYFYPNLIPDIKNIFTSSDSLQVKDISQIDTISQKEKEQEKIESQQKDTNELVQKTEIDSLQKDLDTSVTIKQDEKIDKELESKQEKPEQPIAVQEIKQPEIERQAPQRKKAPLVVSKRKITRPSSAPSKKKSKPTERFVDVASTKIDDPIKEPATSKDNKIETVTSKVISDAVYTVEIYSTASKEDAENWQRKLQNRGVDAFIVKHYVRDLIWYKVRFGAYSSKSEASAKAKSLGFSTFWIDRIK